MKHLIVLFLFLSTISSNLKGQQLTGQERIDSLKVELSKSKEDTSKVRVLYDLAMEHSVKQPDEGIEYASQCLLLSQHINWDKGVAAANKVLGLCHQSKNQFETALIYHQKALEIFVLIDHKINIASSYGEIAIVCRKLSMWEEAKNNYLNAIQAYKSINHKVGMAYFYAHIGSFYRIQNDYIKSIEYINKAIDLNTELKSKESLASNHNELGWIFYIQSDFLSAILHFQKSLKYYEEVNNKSKIAMMCSNLGSLYSSLGDYQRALDYMMQSLALEQEFGNNWGLCVDFFNIGSTYIDLNEPDKALEFGHKALFLSKEIGRKDVFAGANYIIGAVHVLKFEYSKALDYFFEALKVHEETDDKYGVANDYINISSVYLELSDSLETFDKALKYSNMALEYFIEIGALDKQSLAKQNLSLIYEKSDNHQKALEYFKEYKTLQDSIFSVEKTTAIANLEAKRENDLKDKEIALLSKEKSIQQLELEKRQSLLLFHDLESKRQKLTIDLLNSDYEINQLSLEQNEQELIRQQLENQAQATKIEMSELEKELQQAEMLKLETTKKNLFVLFGLLMVAGLGIFLFVFYRRRLKFREKVAVTELKALRAQMNPHFIFNALGSIHNFVMKSDNNKASEYLLKFSKLMRMILHNSMAEQVTLEMEIEALELYMHLESARMRHKFTYDIIIASDINTENILISPLLLQPFVENAILHGLSNKEKQGYVLLKIHKKDNLLHCTIEDNGIGRKKSIELKPVQDLKKGSVGIKLTEERIQIINRQKNTKGEIRFTDLPEGLRVDIELPMEEVF